MAKEMSETFPLFDSVGAICSPRVSPVLVKVGPRGLHAVTSAGHVFRVWTLSPLREIFSSSPPLPSSIVCLTANAHNTFVATKSSMLIYRGPSLLCSCSFDMSTPVALLRLGSDSLVMVTSDSSICVFSYLSTEVKLVRTFRVMEDDRSTVVAAVHPPTYINKILVGAEDGRIFLVNIKSERVVYIFQVESTLTSMQVSPSPDVVLVGCGDGLVRCLNVLYDSVLFVMSVNGEDGNEEISSTAVLADMDTVVVSCRDSSILRFFSLEKLGGYIGRTSIPSLSSSDSRTNSLLPYVCASDGERLGGVLVCGVENAIHMWEWDGRSAKHISCSRGPPCPVAEVGYAADSNGESSPGDFWLRSADGIVFLGGNRVVNQKITKVSSMTTARIPRMEYSDAVCIPIDHNRGVALWSLRELKEKKSGVGSEFSISSATFSACGEYAVLGTVCGSVLVIRVQSGSCLSPWKVVDGSPISCIEVDLRNRFVAVGFDSNVVFAPFASSGTVKRWPPQSDEISSTPLTDHVKWLCLRRDLLAVGMSPAALSVLQVSQPVKEVRKWTLEVPVSAWAFSPDGRTVIAGTMDCNVHVWDVPSGQRIDVFKAHGRRFVCSAAFSCDNQYLALAIQGKRDAQLRVNVVKSRPWSHKIVKSSDIAQVEEEDGVVVLSEGPKSKWKMLTSLGDVQERNRAAVEKQKMADQEAKGLREVPFFLFSAVGNPIGEGRKEEMKSDEVVDFGNAWDSPVYRLIDSGDFMGAMGELANMGVAAVDMEIRMIPRGRIVSWIWFLCSALRSGQQWDAVQSWLRVFIDVHGSELKPEQIHALEEVQSESWDRLDRMLHGVLCHSKFAAHIN